MSMHLSFSDLVNEAAKLDYNEYEKFIEAVNKVRTKRRLDSTGLEEVTLLDAINRGFPNEKWLRMKALDAQMETAMLSEAEHEELRALTVAYEQFSVERLQLLKKLAILRNLSLEEVIRQTGMKNGRS